ncbi:hypothetical protein ACFL6E_02370 [Candidatus Neomarinimicrobiota bacterium]
MIKHFYKKSLQRIDADYETVFHREELNEFEDIDDRDNALFFPMHEEEIVLRAVYYELSSLIEFNMRMLATELINREELIKQRQTDSIDIFFNPKVSTERLISKIQDATGLDIRSIEGYDILPRIRKSLNAFKHRGGLKAPTDMPTRFPEYFEIERNDAYEAIEKVSKFLQQLMASARTI